MPTPRLGLGERFGVRSLFQLAADLGEVVRDGLRGTRFQFDLGSAGLIRPGLSLPAYAGLMPRDGLAPIFNLFDRTGGGRYYSQRVSRARCRDFRGGRLTYDEHDGTDMVCPPGTPLVAAAPGMVVMIRDRWLRGGLTVAVDHGHGVLTQYTHCARALVEIGQPVMRDEPIALSGVSGFDMTQFFPWVAPHIHFMVYVNGRPRDPFLARDEARRAGLWMHGNRPRTSGPLASDRIPERPSAVDEAALERVAEACTDARIQLEIAHTRDRVSSMGRLGRLTSLASLAALIEDALCHDIWAFSRAVHKTCVRPGGEPAPDDVQLTLPLPESEYRGVRLADTRFTAPPLETEA